MPVELSINIADRKNQTSNMSVHMVDGLTLADYDSAAAQMEAVIQPLITGIITSMNIIVPVALPQPRPLPTAGSDVEEGALFIWNTDVAGVTSRNRIPTFNENFVDVDNRNIDITQPIVLAFVDAVSVGLTVPGGTLTFEDYRGADITGAKEAYELFQRSRARRR